jgi:hypothetical protein
MKTQILTLDQIDHIIADTHQKHLECETFINELMNIDITIVETKVNITNLNPIMDKNLNEVTDYILGVNDTAIQVLSKVIEIMF